MGLSAAGAARLNGPNHCNRSSPGQRQSRSVLWSFSRGFLGAAEAKFPWRAVQARRHDTIKFAEKSGAMQKQGAAPDNPPFHKIKLMLAGIREKRRLSGVRSF
jgi:hypothetical protein